MSESIKGLSNLFKQVLINYPTKLKNENDFEKLTMVYMNENFMRLSCPNEEAKPYYMTLHQILKGYINNFDTETLGAIALRSVKIVNELYLEGDLKAIDRFLSLLGAAKSHKGNIIYINLARVEHSITAYTNYNKVSFYSIC